MEKKVIVSVIGLIGLVTIAFGCGASNAKAKGENTVQNLTEPTGKPVGFCWRDSSTCVHRIVAHRLWQAHLLRSSRYGHAARRPQLSSKMPDRPYSQNTVYPVF